MSDEEVAAVSENSFDSAGAGGGDGVAAPNVPTSELAAITRGEPVLRPGQLDAPGAAAPGHPTTQLAIHPDDPDDDWSTGQTRKGLRLHAPTAVLLGLIVLAGGFWGGAVAEKHHSGSPSSSSASSALANLRAAARGAAGSGAGASGLGGTGAGGTGAGGGLGAGGGAAGAATAGIVTGVEGNILYVTDAAGNLVKVAVGPTATVTRTAKSSLTGLQTGDTVVVQGTTGTGGTVTATSVRATAQGVPAGTGARGGGAFAGAGG
jgi:hypothetical protein